MRRKFYLDDFGLIRTEYEDGYLHHGLMLYRNDDEIDVTLKNKDNIKIVYSFMNGEVRKIRNKTIEHKCQMENPEIIENLFERIL